MKPKQQKSVLHNIMYTSILQREIILGHLVQILIFLGFHSFGILIHNDIILTFKRIADTFSDSKLQLKPIFVNLASFDSLEIIKLNITNLPLDIPIKINSITLTIIDQNTNDYIVYHTHVFNIHVTLLVNIKKTLNSRTSRLVSDKTQPKFRYSCDGPGRGGTCQISSWDHIFLSIFWAYNTTSVSIFHSF